MLEAYPKRRVNGMYGKQLMTIERRKKMFIYRKTNVTTNVTNVATLATTSDLNKKILLQKHFYTSGEIMDFLVAF